MDPRPLAPRDDAELAALVERATRPTPFAPGAQARFAARVRARLAPEPRMRWLPALGLGTAAAALALALALGSREEAPPPRALDAASLGESWQEEVLYAPEWIESDDGFLDEEVLPQDYAVAAALLDS